MKIDKRKLLPFIIVVTVSVVILVLLNNIFSFWKALATLAAVSMPLIIGFCIAFAMNPLVKSIEKLVLKIIKKQPSERAMRHIRNISILFSYIIVAAVVAVIMMIIVPQTVSAIKSFIGGIEKYEAMIIDIITRLGLNSVLPDGILDEANGIVWENVIAHLSSLFIGKNNAVIGGIASVTRSALGAVIDTVLALTVSIYVLAGKEKIGADSIRLLHACASEKIVKKVLRLASLTSDAFSAFITGQLTEALVIGGLCFIGMLIFRFPYAVPCSAIIAFTALIPIFGAWIGAGLSALLIFTYDPMTALWFLIYLLILQQVESNMIYPKVVGKTIGLPGLLVIASVCVGGNLLGFTGMLISVPLCSIMYTLIKEALNSRIKKKNASAEEAAPPSACGAGGQ